MAEIEKSGKLIRLGAATHIEVDGVDRAIWEGWLHNDKP